MKSKNPAVFVVVVCALLVIFTCTAPMASGAAPDSQTLKIGQMLEMSGPFAPGLELVQQGTAACAQWINDNGGISVGGKKYKIQLLLEDTKSSSETAVAVANKLIFKEGVKFIIGPVVPPTSMAVTKISEDAKVLRVLSVGLGTPVEINKNTPLTFCPMAATTSIGPLYEYIGKTYPKAKKVAMTSPEDPGAVFYTETAKNWAKKGGMEVVFAEPFPITTQDFFPLCTRLLNTKPDIVDIGFGPDFHKGGLIKALRQLGFTGPIFSADPIDPKVITALAGKDAAHDLITIGLNPASTSYPPVALEIKKRIDAKYPGVYQDRHVGGWSALWMLTQAIEKAQSLDPIKVADTFSKMQKLDGVFGPSTMGGLKAVGANNIVMQPRPLLKIDKDQVTDIAIVKPRFFGD
jgi:branched-chain amino acid transport system substrate-binding protein